MPKKGLRGVQRTLEQANDFLKKAGYERARIVAVLTKDGTVEWNISGSPIDLCWMASALHEQAMNTEGDGE